MQPHGKVKIIAHMLVTLPYSCTRGRRGADGGPINGDFGRILAKIRPKITRDALTVRPLESCWCRHMANSNTNVMRSRTVPSAAHGAHPAARDAPGTAETVCGAEIDGGAGAAAGSSAGAADVFVHTLKTHAHDFTTWLHLPTRADARVQYTRLAYLF